MRDFPPSVRTYYALPGETPEAGPDLRSPGRFLRSVISRQRDVVAAAAVVGVLWQLPLIVGPFLVGRAIDEGVLAHSASAALYWSGLLLAVTVVGAVFGILMHTLVVRSWLIALYGTTLMVTRKAAQLGHVLPRRTPTGEVLSVSGSDADEFGGLTEITARAVLPAGRLPRGGRDRAGHLAAAGPAGPGRRARAGRGGAPAAAPAAPAPGRSSAAHLDADLAGDRHRRGAPGAARDRRRGHLRPQLRDAVPAGPAGRRRRRDLAGRDRGRRGAVLRLLRGAADVRRREGRRGGHPVGRRAGQLPGLRPVHGRADPHLLRVRPEAHPVAGLGPQGRRGPGADADLDGARRTAETLPPADLVDEAPGSWPARAADRRGERAAGVLRRARRPAGPLAAAEEEPPPLEETGAGAGGAVAARAPSGARAGPGSPRPTPSGPRVPGA